MNHAAHWWEPHRAVSSLAPRALLLLVRWSPLWREPCHRAAASYRAPASRWASHQPQWRSKAQLWLAQGMQSCRSEVQELPSRYGTPCPFGQGHQLRRPPRPRRWESGGSGGVRATAESAHAHHGDSWPQLRPIVTMWGCGPGNCQDFRDFKSSCKSRLYIKSFHF